MSPSPPLPSRAVLAHIALAAALLLSTSYAGATEHLSALGLRLTAVIALWLLWPRCFVELRTLHLVVPAGAFLLVLAALPLAPSFGPGLQAVLRVGFVFVVFLLSLAVHPATREAGLTVFFGVAAVHSLWAVGQRLFSDLARGTGGFFNPNDLAACLAPLLVLALARASQKTGGRRWAAIAAGVVVTLGLLASSSRSGLLAAILGVGLLACGRARKWALLPLAVLVVLVAATPSLRDRFVGADDRYSYSRAHIWQQAAQVAWRSPLGVGLGGFAASMRRQGVPLDAPVRYPKVAANAHSELVYAWVELGWLGLLMACLPAFLVLAIAWRRRSHGQLSGDLGVLAAFALPAVVSTSLHVPPVAYLAAWWAGGVLAHDPQKAPTLRLPNGRLMLGLIAGALVLAAVPDAASHAAIQRAAALRDRGQIEPALRYAKLAARAAPWRAGPAVMVESLRFARGDPTAEIVEHLLAIGEVHRTRVEPLARAAALLEREARATNAALLWALAADVRTQQLERDPFDSLSWVALGRARRASGDEVGATMAFERAVTIEPRCARALAHLAAAAHRAGDPKRAASLVRSIREAEALAPAHRGYPREVLSLDPISHNILATLSP